MHHLFPPARASASADARILLPASSVRQSQSSSEEGEPFEEREAEEQSLEERKDVRKI